MSDTQLVMDDLSFLDAILGEMNEVTSKKGVSDLNVCFLGDQDFTMRVVWDSNKKLFNEFRLYRAVIPVKNDKGEEIERTIRYRAPMAWEEDTILPYAEELDNWSYNCKYYNSFFGEIVEITKGQDEYFKPGLCILLANNKRFINALNSAMIALAKKKSGEIQIGKQVLINSLDPYKTGYLINVRSIKGQGGSCNVAFDTLGEPSHKFTEENAKKFDDITKAYCPLFGVENDKNGLLIIDHYKKLISQMHQFVLPATEIPNELDKKLGTLTSKGTPETPKVEKPPTTEAPKEAQPPTTEILNKPSDLDVALEAAGKL